jgi:hypothetical protein
MDIDIAYMVVSTLLDEIYPRINKPFKLKGFSTQDRLAVVFKEEIKRITGSYPKMVYGATEIGVPTVPSIEYPGGFIFDWRVLYCEFIPEEKAISTDKPKIEEKIETVPMEEVQVGKRYQLIVTPFKYELTRYMPDILECVGKGDNILNTDLHVFQFLQELTK